MSHSEWDLAILALERASDRLIAAMPANPHLIEDALLRRAEAIEGLCKIMATPDAAVVARLEKAFQIGGKVRAQLVLGREQLRDGIARMNQSTYLTHSFQTKPEETGRGFDCEA